MCGIFGILGASNSNLQIDFLEESMKNLFVLSASRGKEASGVAVRANHSIRVLKEPVIASKLIKLKEYKNLFSNFIQNINHVGRAETPLAIIGHSRLVTNGSGLLNSNNQPVIKSGAVGIHNGIIVNDSELWNRFTEIERKYEVDTEVFLSLLQSFRKQNLSIIDATIKTYNNIKGSASVCVLFDDIDSVLLSTNNGSLYFCESDDHKLLIFASEKYILKQLINKSNLRTLFDASKIEQIRAKTGLVVNLDDLQKRVFDMGSTVNYKIENEPVINNQKRFVIEDISPSLPYIPMFNNRVLTQSTRDSMLDVWNNLYSARSPLRRCTRCLLPHTTPFIKFDEHGVCNYCHNHDCRITDSALGKEALEKAVSKYRNKHGEPDCIVGFSGGRDSSYALYYVKEILGMNPIAFTFDWGMLTDLGRRNQYKVCGDLGVENILVSADIKQKRNNIRRNLSAWLKKPDLGMVPILMAGDKQFYHYFHEIRKQTGVKLFIFAGGHKEEEDPIKYGFCGIPHGTHSIVTRLTGVSISEKIKLLTYYAFNYLKNPAYINPSIFDTLFAFYSTYMLRDDYLYFFNYIEWDEEKVITTIRNRFDWEMAGDTIATWRIDDGTAPFYNYIYMTIAGFTEFDHFRSTQIRENKITREKGLELTQSENKPRFDALEWYAQVVDFDCNEAIKRINSISKLYSAKI
jgi:glutamine---fructose-6-phosphate transaminase (isomerizing)